MSAKFVSASSQHIQNTSPPITDYPFTVGMWVQPADVTGDKFFFEAVGGTNNVNLYRGTTTFILEVNSAQAVAGTAVANSWSFVVARLISATNRRLAVLNPTGATSHAQDTVSNAISGVTTLDIGGGFIGLYWNGLVARYWMTNTDIQPDAAQLQDGTLRQLAYGGPFSVPHIAGDILEYRSFRKHPTRDEVGEVYYGSKGMQTWALTGATTGIDPPLPYWHVNPGQNKHVLMI